MIYGYARVSTKGQAKDGNSLEAQEAELKKPVLKRYIRTHTPAHKHIDLSLINLSEFFRMEIRL